MQLADYDYLIDAALAEDLGEAGDVTSTALFTEEALEARLTCKARGVLAGADLFAAVFARIDGRTAVDFHRADGADLSPGDHVATITGRATSVLSGERVALNFLSFLSGIATATRLYVDEARAGGAARILDTRKTLPGYRALSKYAVKVGGGTNHRMGLHDMVLLKDNHVDRAGSITRAVEAVRARWGDRYRIEVECRTLAHVTEARDLGVDVIMLDNMSIEQTREAVFLCGGRPQIEASGNMDLSRVREVSSAGVDFISVGRLTHSVEGLDYSLTTEPTREAR
jgi:nicotinate-nucleotide pyrophosphorylase (carboxylating)